MTSIDEVFDWLEANADRYDLHGGFSRGTGGIDALFIIGKLASAIASRQAVVSEPAKMSTAPQDRAILVWWPIVAVDYEGNLTDVEVGGDWLVTEWDNGSWAEPGVLAGLNSNYFDDDREYAEYPSCWMELPPPRALSQTSKPEGETR